MLVYIAVLYLKKKHMKIVAYSDFFFLLLNSFCPTNNYLESWHDGKPLGWKGPLEVIWFKLQLKAGHWTALNRVLSSQVFNISSKGHPATSLETSSNV